MPARDESDYKLLREKIVESFSLKSIEEIPSELNNLITKILRESSQYGLVWEDKESREYFDRKISDGYIPYIHEVESKRIITEKNTKNNVIIEGDNYHTLKALQATHKNKVDVIYIDPPYNTGKGDFKYNDEFVDKEDKFFHSKWLSFIEKRLKLAKNLLALNGVVFISIDENEFAQLKLLCDEVFQQKNFIASFIWLSGSGGSNDKKDNLSVSNEYVFAYSKNTNFKFKLKEKNLSKFVTELTYENKAYVGDDDTRDGELFQLVNINKQTDYSISIKLNDGTTVSDYPSAYPQDTIDELQESGAIVSENGKVFYKKSYLIDEKEGVNQTNIISDVGTTRGGNKILKNMGINLKKMYPKPVKLIKHLVSMCNLKNDAIILDFFAGTGTTGHAVLDLNNKNKTNYQFILCTNNENNICSDVLYKRILCNINGYSFKQNKKTKVVEPLGGGVSYYKVDFYKSDKTYSSQAELLNHTELQEKYVKYIDGLVVLKEIIQDYTSIVKNKKFSIYKNNKKQVVIIKQQAYKNLDLLDEIKILLTEKLDTVVYFFFPDFEGTEQDVNSENTFKELIGNHLCAYGCNIYSIPKEYLRKIIKGEFRI